MLAMPKEERMESAFSAPLEALPDILDQLRKELVTERNYLAPEVLTTAGTVLAQYEVLFYWQLLRALEESALSPLSQDHLARIRTILEVAKVEPWTDGSRNVIADRIASVVAAEGWRNTGELNDIFRTVIALFTRPSPTP
jgi:hypothetical protein